MIRINIIAVGKIKESFYREALAEYIKRLGRFAKVEIKEIAERRTLAEEAADILRAKRGYAIALAIEGERLTSEGLAKKIKSLCDRGEEISFIIGSSCGLNKSVKDRADFLLSFSDMTFPHQLMRVILAEQIYRAFMINSGAEYHK